MACGRSTLFLAIVIVSVSAVSGLFFTHTCWVCDGNSGRASSSACNDPSQLGSNALVSKVSGCNYCKKYGSSQSVTRTCEQECTSSTNVLCCVEYLCNSATKRQRSTLTLIAALPVALYRSLNILIG